MKLAFVHARAETLALLRTPSYSLTTLLFPPVLLLVLGRQVVDEEPERLTAGFAATAVLSVVFFQFGVGVALSRITPWELYVRTLPVRPAERVAGRVLSALTFAFATVAFVAVIGYAVFDARLSVPRAAIVVAALLVGAVPFGFLGVALGYWAPPRSALPIANLAFLPLVIGGSMWARPPEDVPHGVDVASQLLPTRSWIEMIDSITTQDSPLPLHHVVALALWAATFFALAWWGYRRDEGERFR